MRPLDPRLVHHARATRGYLLASVALGGVTAGLVIAQAWLLAVLVTGAFLHGEGLPELRRPMVELALVLGARALVSWAQEVTANRSSAAVKSQLRQALLAHVVRLGPAWLTGERSGELTVLVTRGVDALDGYFARYLPQLVLACIVPVAVLVEMFSQDWVSALVVAVTLPLVPVFMVLVGMATQERTRRQWRTLSVLSHHFLDVVAGLPTLKVFGRARAQAERIRAATDEHRTATLHTLRLAFVSSLVLELLSTLSVALVAVGVGLRLLAGHLDLRTALFVLVLAPEAYLPLRQVGALFHASAEGVEAAGQVFAVLEQVPRAEGTGTEVPDPALAGLTLDRVTVRHAGAADPVLRELSERFAPGELVAVVGASGVGKSSLLSTVLGFLGPESGRVLVGDVDLATVDPALWRANVAWLPQRPHVVTGTLADNVRLGEPDATDTEVEDALAAAAADFVRRLPAGTATRLGEGGSGISSGQRQRIGLARVILRTRRRDCGLLLLDEPTAHLDADTEERVVASLRDLAVGRTVVAVAHRAALVAAADRVLRLRAVAPEPAAHVERATA